MNVINLPSNSVPTMVIFFLRFDTILAILGMALVMYGFLYSHKNTRFYAERLMVYNFIFGLAAASYYFSPDFTIEWILGGGWQYSIDSLGVLLIDQLLFLPILELFIHTIRRLRAPFRTKKSHSTVSIFFLGLFVLIGANLISYFVNLVFYIALAVGFAFMTIAFLIDPLVLTISHVKIFDLVVGAQSVSVGRFNFEKKQTIQNEQLFSGALSGISNLTGEMLSTTKELLMLQTEDKAVLIHKSKHSKIYLVTDTVDEICKVSMELLGHFVDEYYQKRNLAFNINIDPALFEREVLKIFTFA